MFLLKNDAILILVKAKKERSYCLFDHQIIKIHIVKQALIYISHGESKTINHVLLKIDMLTFFFANDMLTLTDLE
jgi:hypothetical protein